MHCEEASVHVGKVHSRRGSLGLHIQRHELRAAVEWCLRGRESPLCRGVGAMVVGGEEVRPEPSLDEVRVDGGGGIPGVDGRRPAASRRTVCGGEIDGEPM